MGKIIFLGTASAVPGEKQENTHLAVIEGDCTVLVDCASNPIVRLQQAGILLDQLTDLILTHFHPDHVGGLPLLLMGMWLLGRKKPLQIYGLNATISRAEAMMNLYDWKKWPDFFPVHFHTVPEDEQTLLLECDGLRISSSPVKHLIPTLGLRIDFLESGRSAAYSCDTEPCPQMAELAAGVDVLIHEATGAGMGHSSAAQAGGIAQQAGAAALYLIHYGPQERADTLLAGAKQEYTGPVYLARDFMSMDF